MYEDMTDFEINKAVCATKGVKVDDEQYEGLCDRDERIVLCRDELGMSIGVDYCNDPADAWPIIELIFRAGVTLMINDSGVTTSNLGEKYGGKSIDVNCKPLRAAMIVYLETKAAI